eukprot:m.157102 g.157102  ORF g.157102 m.157102 type:complete len:492 (-) comp17962_c0_seq1:226-1701(-)
MICIRRHSLSTRKFSRLLGYTCAGFFIILVVYEVFMTRTLSKGALSQTPAHMHSQANGLELAGLDNQGKSDLVQQKGTHLTKQPLFHRRNKKHNRKSATTHLRPFSSNATAVVWRLPVGCDYSGFFVEVLGLLDAMDSILHPNFYFDLGAKCSSAMLETLTEEERFVLTSLQNRSAHILDRLEYYGRKFVIIQHKQPNSPYKSFKGKENPPLISIGRAMSEQSVLSAQEVEQNRAVDELWVPTPWHQDIYAASGISQENIAVIPEAVDTSFFKPSQRKRRQPDVKFRFVSVFKWEHRKGFDALLQAFWEEFQENTAEVELVLRTYKPSWEPGSANLVHQFARMAKERLHGGATKELPEVVWIKDELSRNQLRLLYESSHAFVLPTRGEGWGLPIVEAMAMGLPTIATNFSGPTAYLNMHTGYPVTFTMNHDGTAEPDIRSLRAQMRRVFDKWESEALPRARTGRRFVRTTYAAPTIAALCVQRINRRLRGL